MLNQETVKFINQIQFFTNIMFYSLLISVLCAGMVGGLREIDHPGHKQWVLALANLMFGALIFMWLSGDWLR
jgi:hypothetical protein